MTNSYFHKKKIIITGGDGFIGSALARKLKYDNADIFIPKIKEYDLTKTENIDRMFYDFKPEILIHLAADVGGISYLKENCGSTFFNNVIMNTLLLEKARKNKVKKFIGINSVNCYPKNIKVPFNEENLWDGLPDENVLGYGLSKRMMIVQSMLYKKQYNFNAFNLILESVYGPNDIFEKGKARVIPANIIRCIDAVKKNKEKIEVWGSGEAIRDFLYIDDAVDGIITAVSKDHNFDIINIGSGNQIRIKNLIEKIAELEGFNGKIEWDTTKPEGLLERYLDINKIKKMGFKPNFSIENGLKNTIDWYVQNIL